MSDYCHLWLTCKDEAEASKIARSLLVKHLVACAKQVPIKSDYRWQGEAYYRNAEPSVASAKEGKIVSGDEVLLIMDSREDLFEQVEQEVTRLHSYDNFVLQSVPVGKVSQKARTWLVRELQ